MKQNKTKQNKTNERKGKQIKNQIRREEEMECLR